MTSNDLVGTGALHVADLRSAYQILDVPLYYKNKSAGSCKVKVRYEPNAVGPQQTGKSQESGQKGTLHTGTIRLAPMSANLTRDTETFGKMDPYCVVTVGKQKFKTLALDGAGTKPNWAG